MGFGGKMKGEGWPKSELPRFPNDGKITIRKMSVEQNFQW
jgi:hypothetical protein